MTDEEVKRMLERIRRYGQYESVERAYDSTFRRAERIQQQDAECMEERSWIQRAFMGTYTDGTEEMDRHPRARTEYVPYSRSKSRPITKRVSTRYGDIYGWVMENSDTMPETPVELTAGDTSQLDDFLSGFSKQEV